MWANELVTAGYAVFRYDKRGVENQAVNMSMSEPAPATTLSLLASECCCQDQRFEKTSGIDPTKLLLWAEARQVDYTIVASMTDVQATVVSRGQRFRSVKRCTMSNYAEQGTTHRMKRTSY